MPGFCSGWGIRAVAGRNEEQIAELPFCSLDLLGGASHCWSYSCLIIVRCSFLKSSFSNGEISNSIFHGETVLKGFSSVTEIWLKLCLHYWSEFRNLFVVMRFSGHFLKHNFQVYPSLGRTIFWVYTYHKIKYTLTLFSSKFPLVFFMASISSPEIPYPFI